MIRGKNFVRGVARRLRMKGVTQLQGCQLIRRSRLRTRPSAICLRGKLDAERSPFVSDVDAGTAEIVIDLERPPG